MPKPQSTKTIDELPRKLLRFAELLVQGYTASKAARECGFSKTTANSGAYRWVGRTRESSQYPALFDYYEDLRKEKLRLYDVSVDTIVNELKIIAFSKIDNYLDLPSQEVYNKIEKLTEELHAETAKLEQFIDPEYEKAQRDPNKQNLRGVKKYLAEAKPIAEKINKIDKQIQKLRNGPGSYLRLKYREDIPPELMPAIAEIRHTREGIAVKLHSKMDALDMLAKWQKMYSDQKEGGEESPDTVKTIELVVNGSKSKLLGDQQVA